jgi:hypothetical protein
MKYVRRVCVWRSSQVRTLSSYPSAGMSGKGLEAEGYRVRIHHHECNFSIVINHIVNLNALLLHN